MCARVCVYHGGKRTIIFNYCLKLALITCEYRRRIVYQNFAKHKTFSFFFWQQFNESCVTQKLFIFCFCRVSKWRKLLSHVFPAVSLASHNANWLHLDGKYISRALCDPYAIHTRNVGLIRNVTQIFPGATFQWWESMRRESKCFSESITFFAATLASNSMQNSSTHWQRQRNWSKLIIFGGEISRLNVVRKKILYAQFGSKQGGYKRKRIVHWTILSTSYT